MTWNLPAERAGLVADLQAHGGVGSGLVQYGPLTADTAARMHDPSAAELYLETSADSASMPWVVAMTHFVHGWEALDRRDGARAAAEMEAFGAAYSDPVINSTTPGYNCWIAPAEEMAGHPDKADAALQAGGRFVDCYRFRADILDHRGDWPAAQQAYAAAVALAPDLPAAYYSWGLALARHGDLDGATAKYAAANQRGPHWSDPLKAWGDALAAQGRWKAAAAKYDQAAAYAPAWAALQTARAAAHRRAGS
jgi:tetratricopeptide (TPR) repeat protein